MTRTSKRYSRAGLPWSRAEDAKLTGLYLATPAVPFGMISAECLRPYRECRARVKALKLARPRKPRPGGESVKGGVQEGRVADEGLRAKCRQLARDLGPAGRAAWWELRGGGWSEAYARWIVGEGAGWFEADDLGVALTPAGRDTLVGGLAGERAVAS